MSKLPEKIDVQFPDWHAPMTLEKTVECNLFGGLVKTAGLYKKMLGDAEKTFSDDMVIVGLDDHGNLVKLAEQQRDGENGPSINTDILPIWESLRPMDGAVTEDEYYR
jgi:hypothetical protein